MEHPNQNWNNNYLIYLYADYEHVVITKNANTPFEVVAEDINNASIRYTYKVGDRILTPFGIETIKEIIKDYNMVMNG